MNIPNPAELKKMADERRKVREAELASDLELSSKTKSLPETTGSYKGRHSKKSASSEKKTEFQDRSSSSRDSHRSMRSTSKPTGSDISTDIRSTSTTSKKNSTIASSLLAGKGKNSLASAKESVEKVLSGTSKNQRSSKVTGSTKKPFERSDHLTQRPLRNHPGLKAMLESRPNDTRIRREVEKVTRQMQSHKAQRANKENN